MVVAAAVAGMNRSRRGGRWIGIQGVGLAFSPSDLFAFGGRTAAV